jgi:sodium/bile acid cotransporter 7
MRDWLRKRWFSLLLLGGVGLAWFRPDLPRPLTRFVEPRVVVPLSLFLIAVSLESRSLWRAVLRPLPVFWAVGVSYGVAPALAWAVGGLLPEDLRVGLLIITSVPCTLASAALWTRLAGGNEALAMLVIFLTTATSWLVTTAWLTATTGAQVAVDAADMMHGLVLLLVVPVGLGQLCRAARPFVRFTTRHKPVLGVLSRLLIFAMIFKAVVDVSAKLGEGSAQWTAGSLAAAAALSLGLHGTALAWGYWSGRFLRLDRGDRIAIAFAGSQKTLPVGLVLFDAYFKETYPLAVVPLVLYHVGQFLIDTPLADIWARRRMKAASTDPILVGSDAR